MRRRNATQGGDGKGGRHCRRCAQLCKETEGNGDGLYAAKSCPVRCLF